MSVGLVVTAMHADNVASRYSSAIPLQILNHQNDMGHLKKFTVNSATCYALSAISAEGRSELVRGIETR
jgi:hypothetical protein